MVMEDGRTNLVRRMTEPVSLSLHTLLKNLSFLELRSG
jgi:hypothetical protein